MHVSTNIHRQTLPLEARVADSSSQKRGKGNRKGEQRQTEKGVKMCPSLLGPVEDIDLLQKQAVIEGHSGSLRQKLEDDPCFRPDEDHCVVLVGSCFIVHSQSCQPVPRHAAGRRGLVRADVIPCKIEEAI